MIDQRELDRLWDFADPIASEARLREASLTAPAVDRAEYSTQLARALGLQDRFDEARSLLDGIDPTSCTPAALVRIDLERGRVENSAGRPAAAVPHFLHVAEAGAADGLDFLRIDALHMLAIADRDHAVDWTRQGVEAAAASSDDRTRRWAVSLHNNLGWTLYEAGDLTGAIAEFEQALGWAEQVGTEDQRRYAREALDQAHSHLDESP
ncbi:hypothetical protein FOE78_08085 [Microlunatus elymi]|uniref:Tetratricopeptide repeat-containing protein n=1 Tax=Microlunatus elymi TaxID=2596828 RepID=A0A516PXI3_9ACTN|nr:hypothetical protein [Microlunatus elymi]QDP95862.1 hypothetical protein FOE78_08085 [Microlunatus elymi]